VRISYFTLTSDFEQNSVSGIVPIRLNGPNTCHNYKVISRVSVTKDGVRIGNWIY
jgi:hypothetical protein